MAPRCEGRLTRPKIPDPGLALGDQAGSQILRVEYMGNSPAPSIYTQDSSIFWQSKGKRGQYRPGGGMIHHDKQRRGGRLTLLTTLGESSSIDSLIFAAMRRAGARTAVLGTAAGTKALQPTAPTAIVAIILEEESILSLTNLG